jgi:NAD+ kinase
MKISEPIISKDNKILNLNKIGILYNVEHQSACNVAKELEKILINKGIPMVVMHKISDKREKPTADKDFGLAVIIGGDGTILGAARCFSPYNVPLLGINTGRLGFLSQLNILDMQKGIDKILSGDFYIESRLMIKCYVDDESKFYTALNDVVIKGSEISRTSKLFLYINGKHVCDYLADGLIISTPTGSTAYTLSAGGPVVVPELEAFVIVPICPHSLTTRPIVIPADTTIEVKIDMPIESICVTNDGQETLEIGLNKNIFVKKSEYKASLIHFETEDNGFYSILRKKLHWGVSPPFI